MAANQGDVFPKNRFSLELVDALLDAPCVFPLTEPVITIGLSGGNSWNLPLERMGLESMKLWGKDEKKTKKKKKKKPLLTLKFRPKSGTWKASQAYGPGSSYTEPKNCDWNAAFSQLEPGLRVKASLPHDLGFFTLILHDAERRPSAFTQKLASLPDVPLGIIASYLHPVHCVRHLCSFSQTVAEKLCTAGVEWPQVSFLDMKTDGDGIKSLSKVDNFLDCMRVAKLLRNGDRLEALFLGTGIRRWQKEAAEKLLFDQARKFIFAPKLQHLGLVGCWLPRIGSEPLPETLGTMYVEFEGCSSVDACDDFWFELSELKLPTSTEVTVFFRKPGPPTDPGSDFCGYDREVPNVVKVCLDYCGHHYFLPRNGLTNLRELELSNKWWHDQMEIDDLFDMSAGYDGVTNHLKESCFPALKKIILHISKGYVRPVVDAFATDEVAPNLEVIELHLISTGFEYESPWRSPRSVDCCRSSVDSFRKLPNLRHVKMTFEEWTPKGLEAVLKFCLAMESTISTIEFDEVLCDDVWSPGVRHASESLKQRGRIVNLTELGGEAKQLRLPDDLLMRFTKAPVFGFKVVVCDE